MVSRLRLVDMQMGKVQEALQRLEAAVAHLELATGRAGDGGPLAVAKAEYAALADTTEAVAHRLDVVIGRLDRVLED